jgi:hypothetical protein
MMIVDDFKFYRLHTPTLNSTLFVASLLALPVHTAELTFRSSQTPLRPVTRVQAIAVECRRPVKSRLPSSGNL